MVHPVLPSVKQKSLPAGASLPAEIAHAVGHRSDGMSNGPFTAGVIHRLGIGLTRGRAGSAQGLGVGTVAASWFMSGSRASSAAAMLISSTRGKQAGVRVECP